MSVSYNNFLTSWESQQNALIEMREERFSFMMDIIEEEHTGVKKILDAGCGPGSFTMRLAKRFPGTKIYSIDYDPVLLKLAKNNTSAYSSRVNILEYDLKENQWAKALADEKFDAIVSTTALHWLPESSLPGVYKNFYNILKENGIFMDGDHFRSTGDSEELQSLYSKIREKIAKSNIHKEGAMNWEEWWEYVSKSGVFNEDLKERSKRYSSGAHDQKVTLEEHIDILNKSGFNTAGVVWQYLDNRVLFARK
jgi:cyclopropane fatty-acyl-phospholipid synthase-like methyltransferase